MSRQKRSSTSEGNFSSTTLVLVSGVAFLLGAGMTWLIMRNSHEPTKPPTTSIVSTQNPVEQMPDVSRLTPVEAATTLGNWNYDRQHWEMAIQQYEQAIALGGDNADLRTDLGNCYRFTAQPQKALEQYGIAQRQNPQHEHSLFNTAGIYGEVLHDSAKAAATWREYLRRFPNTAGAARARKFLAEAEQGEAQQTDLLKKFVEGDGVKK